MKEAFACLMLILIIALTPEVQKATAAMPGPKGCYDPVDFGAIPDDGVSDQVPAQQALDAASANGGRVCFGATTSRLLDGVLRRSFTKQRFECVSINFP